MIRFLGQAKYSSHELIGYELFLRELNAGQWQFPKDFGTFDPREVAHLLVQTIQSLPASTQLVSINLDQPQFILPIYADVFGKAQQACTNTQIVVELTEHPDGVAITALLKAAKAYKAQKLWVCLDDVGTGDNTVELAEAFGDTALEYKFALQNFRGKSDFITSVSPQLQFWWEQAKINHVFLAIEGFENQSDLQVAENYHADILQGYYFDRPHLIQIDPAGGAK